jgi:hypothetical protein
MTRLIALLVLLSALGGCARYDALKHDPASNTDTVRQKLGEPAHRYERNGLEIWEYDGGPYAYYGYHFEFDAQGALTRVVQTRTEENAQNILLHTATADDVKAIVGWPVHEYRVRGNTIWEWPMVNKVGLPARLAVQFAEDGTVSDVATYLLPTGARCRTGNSLSCSSMRKP